MQLYSGKVTRVSDTSFWPEMPTWSTTDTFRGEENGLFGDLVGLKKGDKIFLTFLLYDSSNEKRGYHIYQVENGNMVFKYVAETTAVDMESIYVDGESCMILCKDRGTSNIKCITDGGTWNKECGTKYD